MDATASPPPAPARAEGLRARPGLAPLLAARTLSALAAQAQAVAVGWQLWALTHRPLALGLAGLAQFLPVLLLTFVAGHVVDRFDRRAVAAIAQALQLAASATLASLALTGSASPIALYTIVFAVGAARAFEAPSMQALLPAIAGIDLFPRAAALSSALFQVAAIGGPSLGGVLYGFGPAVAFGAAAASFALAFGATARLPRPARSPGVDARPRPTLRAVFGGVAFIRSQPAILGAISLDLFAVLLGGATALLPVFASSILNAGPLGLGALRAAPAIGALAVSVVLARRPLGGGQGRVMFGAVAVFGAATIAFGLSRSLPVSVAALAVLGGADVVSVVIRSTLIQHRTPDAMRGRVAAVNMLFIGSSNQLGEFESGSLAALIGTVPAVVAGGVGTLVVTALWCGLFPSLRRLERP